MLSGAAAFLGRVASFPHFASLRNYRDFRTIWLTGMFSFGGMWAFLVAASWIAHERSDGGSGWVGVITFFALVPFLVISPIGGLLADRIERRTLVWMSTVLNTVVAVGIAAAALTDSLELWHLAAAAFVGGGSRAAMEPGIQALIPNQVAQGHILNAITLNGLTHHASRFFGLLVAAPLLGVEAVGPDGVLVLSAALTGAAIFFAARCRTVSRGDRTPGASLLRSLMEGLAYVYTHRNIAVFILLVALHCALTMSFESIMPVFSTDSLGATDGSFIGYLNMGFGLGSAIGILLVAGVREESTKGKLLFWTAVVSGLAPIVLAVSGHIVPATLFTGLMGASQASFMAISNAYVIIIAPDRLRGRISSLYALHAGGIMAFANLGYGFLADVFSAWGIFIVTGAVFVAAVLGLYGTQPVFWRVYRSGQLTAA